MTKIERAKLQKKRGERGDSHGGGSHGGGWRQTEIRDFRVARAKKVQREQGFIILKTICDGTFPSETSATDSETTLLYY